MSSSMIDFHCILTSNLLSFSNQKSQKIDYLTVLEVSECIFWRLGGVLKQNWGVLKRLGNENQIGQRVEASRKRPGRSWEASQTPLGSVLPALEPRDTFWSGPGCHLDPGPWVPLIY